MRIVLASSSPRRRELLDRLGVTFRTASPDIDESTRAGEGPVAYVRRLAAEKAHAVAAEPDELVIAADTTVDVDDQILAKPNDEPDPPAAAAAMLRRLSGRTHTTHTGVAVRLGDRTEVEVVTTEVTFVPLTEADIAWYVATGEPLDKAGAYALQGTGGVFVEKVDGSVSSVVGLPLHTVVALAARLGVRLLG